jgi:hypothetical protein
MDGLKYLLLSLLNVIPIELLLEEKQKDPDVI